MRRFFIVFPLVAVLSLLQGIAAGLLQIGGIALVPDLAMIFLILFSMIFGRGVGQSVGWLAGLLEDFAVGTAFGFYALIKLIIVFVFSGFQGRFTVGSVGIALGVVGVATILKYLLFWMLGRLFGLHTALFASLMPTLFIELLLNLLFTLPAYWAVKAIVQSAASFIRREQKV